MEIKKIEIKNYQALNNIKLELVPGLNVITGNSNNGKSAVIRAIRDLIFNSFQNSKIKHGQEQLNIKINEEVEAIRNKNTKYIIENKEYDKVGRVPLVEIKELLKLGTFEINKIKIIPNFSFQMDKPFLFDKTPGQKYELIIGTKQDAYLKALKSIKENANELNKVEKKVIQTQIDDLKKNKLIFEEKIKKLENLDNLYKKITEINKDKNNIIKLSNLINDFENSEEQIVDINKKIKYIEELFAEKINSNEIVNKYDEINKLKQMLFNFLEKEEEITKTDRNLKKINELNGKKINDNSIQQHKEHFEKLKNEMKLFFKIISEGKLKMSDLNEIKKELDKIKKEFYEYKKEVEICPLCGGKL